MAVAVIGVALIFFLGHALKWIFIHTKIPDLLLLVLLGFLIGPVFGVIDASALGKVGPLLSTVALIVILYEGGITLHAKDLVSSSLPALGLSLIGFILVVFFSSIAAWVFTQDIGLALLFGIGISSTSSAIVIPTVKYLSIEDKTKTILSLESAFTDVLAIVIFLVVLDASLQGKFSFAQLLIGIGPNTLKAILVGCASGILWSFLRNRFLFLSDIKFSGEAWALLSYGILELMKLNGAIGVLALGFTLANLDLLPQFAKNFMSRKPMSYMELELLGEVTFLLKTTFFIFLGMQIKFSNWMVVIFAIVITALIFVLRYFMVLLVLSKKNYYQLDAMITAAMGPRGLACAVLATLPIQRGLEGGDWLQDTMFALIPMTIIVTATLIVMFERESMRRYLSHFFIKYTKNMKINQSDHHTSDHYSLPKPALGDKPDEEKMKNNDAHEKRTE